MKARNQKIKTLILTAGFTLCSTLTVMAASYEGQLDAVTDAAVTGWAKDAASPDSPVKVSILITPEGNTEPVREITLFASDYRNSDEYASRSAGYCGFNWNIDWSELNNGNYNITLRFGTRTVRKSLSYTNTIGRETAAAEPAKTDQTQESGRSLGVFKTTAYCPCYACSEGWGRSTSTGATARSNHTIAVDPRIIPYGSKVMIDGIIYTAEDRGGGVKGNHIDVFYDSHSETKQHGVRYKEVYLVS